MSDKGWYIKRGDRVRVSWERIEFLEGEIIQMVQEEQMAMPEYYIKDDDGIIHQVMHYCKISQCKKLDF